LDEAVRRTGPAAVVLWSQSRTTANLPLARHIAASCWGVKGARTHPTVFLAGPGWPATQPPGMIRPHGLRDALSALARIGSADSDLAEPRAASSRFCLSVLGRAGRDERAGTSVRHGPPAFRRGWAAGVNDACRPGHVTRMRAEPDGHEEFLAITRSGVMTTEGYSWWGEYAFVDNRSSFAASVCAHRAE
jgi:hypothetical protein